VAGRRTVSRLPDLQSAAAAGRTVRYRTRSWAVPVLMVLIVFVLAFGIGFIWFASHVLATSNKASALPLVIFGLVVGVLAITLDLWLLPLALRPALTIAAGSLRIPRGAFGTIRVPVTEVTGIGLVAERSTLRRAPPPRWHMMVWHADERSEPVSIFYAPSRAPQVFAETDPAELAGTYAGQVAGDLYRYVLAQQGPAGRLAVTEQQKHVRSGSRWAPVNIQAFWSPDGVVGPAR
jgi:hypothetical protein